MIQCPYCNTALTETSVSCPDCNLNLERANAVMGPVPMLSASGITDLTRRLLPAEEKHLHRTLQTFRRRFPQSQLFILLNEFTDHFPPASHLFWIFNAAGLSRVENKRGLNRDILIGIDPTRHWAGLIIGYGLEPFLGQEALDHILEQAIPCLEGGRISEAIDGMITHLGDLMEGVCRDLPSTLGLHSQLTVESASTDY